MENLNDHTRLLAESQAREAQLREALQSLDNFYRELVTYTDWRDEWIAFEKRVLRPSRELLEQPADGSALQAALAAERAKVSDFVRNNYQDHNIASICDAIRELENE